MFQVGACLRDKLRDGLLGYQFYFTDIFSALSVIRQKLTSKDAGEQLAAIDRLNRLHERLARLEGLDAPAKTDVTSGGQAIAVVAVAVDMARFAPPDDDDDLHDPSGSDGG